jgi:hypothetical protein
MLSIISIMKSTERYSVDTQITDSIDSKSSILSVIATYRPYHVNNYVYQFYKSYTV